MNTASLFRLTHQTRTSLSMITTATLFSTEQTDERSLEFLAAAIEKNNLPGFDYFEFKRAVAALKAMPLEEATAYKSAFKTAETLGINKEKLLETAAYYRNLVLKEKDHFDQALNNQHTARIDSREAELKRLNDQIERHKAEIARLEDEVGNYLNQVDAAEKSLKQDREKLEKAKKSFEQTHHAVITHIEKDIEHLHQYL